MNIPRLYGSIIFLLLNLPFGYGSTSLSRNDDHFRKDSGLALGRGYSVASGDVGAMCLTSEAGLTTPTYDYDFIMNEVEGVGPTGVHLTAEFGDLVAFQWLVDQIGRRRSVSSTQVRNFIIMGLRVDKYYSGLKEPMELAPEPLSSLSRGDVIGFFQMCMPGYVQSIRRTAEVVFSMDYVVNRGVTDTRTYDQIQTLIQDPNNSEELNISGSMTVAVKASGVAVPRERGGLASFVTLNPQDIPDVMEFSFKSIVGNENSGVIQSIEIIPWHSNYAFLIASRSDFDIRYNRCFDSNMRQVSCSDTERVASNEELVLPSVRKRFNLFSNAEHILNLERKLKKDLQETSALNRCLGTVHRLSECDRSLYIQNRVNTNEYITGQELVDILTTVSSETNDISPFAFKVQSLNTYVREYYSKCLSALSENDAGLPSGKMYTTHFSEIDDCTDITCTLQNSYYDEESESCGLRTSGNVDGIVEAYCDPIIMDPQPLVQCRTRLLNGEIAKSGEHICNGDFSFGSMQNGGIGFFHKYSTVLFQVSRLSDSRIALRPGSYIEWNMGQLLYIPGSLNGLSDDCNHMVPPDNNDRQVIYESPTCTSSSCYLEISPNGSLIISDGTITDTEFEYPFIYTFYASYSYALSFSRLTYDEHKDIATSLGGVLVDIQDNPEREHLALSYLQYGDFFIGLERDENGWTWSNGDSFTTNNLWVENPRIDVDDVAVLTARGADNEGRYRATGKNFVNRAVYKWPTSN